MQQPTRDLNESIKVFNETDTAPVLNENNTNVSLFADVNSMNQYDEYKVALVINEIYLKILVSTGIPGNIAAVITISQMKPLTAFSSCVAILALTDSCVLGLKLLFTEVTGEHIKLGQTGCGVFLFLLTMLPMFSSWLVAIMAIERYIAVSCPLHVKRVCTRRNAAITMTICAFLLVLLNLHLMWTITENPDPHGQKCIGRDNTAAFINNIWFWIDAVFYAFLPCILLFTFNSLIILKVRNFSKSHGSITSNRRDSLTRSVDQQIGITKLLLAVSLIFLVLNVPNAMFYALKSQWTYTVGSRGHAQYILVNQIIFLLSDANFAINFYLYFVTGSSFRRKFLDLLCCRKNPRRWSLQSSDRRPSCIVDDSTTSTTL